MDDISSPMHPLNPINPLSPFNPTTLERLRENAQPHMFGTDDIIALWVIGIIAVGIGIIFLVDYVNYLRRVYNK